MDWVLIGAIVIAGWAMLSVLSCERLDKAQRLAVAVAAAAAANAKANEAEIPIAGSIAPTPMPTRKAA